MFVGGILGVIQTLFNSVHVASFAVSYQEVGTCSSGLGKICESEI